MSIKEFADKYIKAMGEAWEKGNFKALEALEAPNVVWHRLPSRPAFEGREDVGWETHKKFFLSTQQNMSNLRNELKYLTGEGNLFALSLNRRFILTREIPASPESIGKVGKEGTMDGLMLFRLESGKVVEVWAKPGPTVFN